LIYSRHPVYKISPVVAGIRRRCYSF